MPALGPLEILVVAALALIVFGPQRLPDVARSIGRALGEVRRMAADVTEEFQAGLALDDDADGDQPWDSTADRDRDTSGDPARRGPGSVPRRRQRAGDPR